MRRFTAGKYDDEILANAEYIRKNVKGMLRVDDSIEKCFSVEDVESFKRSFHDYLIPNAGNLNGVILFEESFCQTTIAGKPVLNILTEIFGQSDRGGGFMGIIINNDLPSLAERCAKYYLAGFRVAKLFKTQNIMRPHRPRMRDIQVTVKSFVKNAATCQKNGLVPILDVEIVSDDIEWCALVAGDVLCGCFCSFNYCEPFVQATLLKPNMVVPGENVAPLEMANRLLDVLRDVIPVGVPAVVISEDTLFQEILKSEKSKVPYAFISMHGQYLLKMS